MFVMAGGRRDRIIFKNPSGLILEPGDLASDVEEVWYADCCPPDLLDPCQGRPFKVFDHHVSNERKFGTDPRCRFDMKQSGTSLMSEVLGVNRDDSGAYFGGGTTRLIRALEAYDLGRFSEPDGVWLADLATTLTQEEMLDALLKTGAWLFDDQSMQGRVAGAQAVRQLYAENAAKYARRSELANGNGYITLAVAVSPVYWKNDVATHILLDPRVQMAVVIDPTGGMVSLRSREDGPDCSIIAAGYGGGGHARAAGFKIDTQKMLGLLDEMVFG
mgnify:CR=1 FL=1